MLIINKLYRSFGEKEVLRGVSLELEEGTIAGLIGPSGGGKSALLKIIAGVDAPDSGTFDWGANDSGAKDSDRQLLDDHRLSLMFQEGALFDSLSVFDNVAFPLTGGRVPASTLPNEEILWVHEKVESILDRVGLTAAAYKMPGQLSGGMRRRVSLARALVTRPRYLLLDDPTSGLDPIASSVIMNLVVSLHKEYRPTMLIVSHDLRRLLPVLEKVFALFDGRITYAGNVKDLVHAPLEDLVRFVACRYDLYASSDAEASNSAGAPTDDR